MRSPVHNHEEIEELLARERANLMAQYARIPAERRADAPAAGGWSAVQVVEHVARVEAGVAKMLQKGATMPLTATAEEMDAAQITPRTIAIVRDRSTKAQAPERTLPTGSVSPESAISALLQSREALLAGFYETADPVLDGITFVHPFVGPLTLRAWVELVAHHDARHAAQLAELGR
jgi:hypothetical protein